MSRRKQLKPQHVNNQYLIGSIEEFSLISDLEQRQTLLVNEDLLSGSKTFPAASFPAEPAGQVHDFQMENRDTPSQDRSNRSVESPGSSNPSQRKTDSVLCTSLFPESLAQPGYSADPERYSWRKSNVIIENLESTKVGVAQSSQLMHSDGRRGEAAIWSLLQQLLALQIQQVHQLQLIHQIRHQVLLFASHQAEMPETLMIRTKDLSSSKSTNQLKALSAHLSQKLAAAAGTAKGLSAQSANISGFRHFTATEQRNQSQPDDKDVLSSSECSPTFRKLMLTAVCERVSKEQHVDGGSSDCKLNLLSQTKMSSLMFSNNYFISKTSENPHIPQPSSSSQHTALSSILNLRAIVEDLDALADLAQQRECKNLKLSAPTLSSKESLFKHKCRFCGKDFGSNSALQIPLRSHTGERPYQCNICGNRFSTRGNLKVNFQRHKERSPHIPMNLYLVPEHLDNIQTNAGIAFGTSSSPEKAAARWLDRSPSPTTVTSGSIEQLDSTNLSCLIKKEENITSVPIDLYFDSTASMDSNPTKASDSVETRQQRTTSNFVCKTMTTKSEESVDVIPNPFTHPHSTSLSGFLSLKRSDNHKLQLQPDTTDKRVSDPNECVICHRILSCRSALRMHHRTHTGERPYQCKLCGRAFTTKGNLKTHQAVHRATVPLGVQHSCPFCQRKFTNAVVLQQHVHVHVEGHSSNADCTNQKYSVDFNEGPRDKTEFNHRKNFSDDSNGGFYDKRLSRFKSLSIRLSSSPSSKNLSDANKKTSYHESQGELQLKWIKTKRPERSNEESCQTNNQPAAGSGQWCNNSASKQSMSPGRQASLYFKPARLDEPLQMWLDSTSLTLCASATASTDLQLFHHAEDSPSFIHNVREKGIQKNTFCDMCGKNLACQSALDIHYRSHTKERPFICTTCNRGFSTKGNLKQHMLTHQMRDFPPHLFEPSSLNEAQPTYNGSTGSQPVNADMAAFLKSSFRSGKDLSGHSQRASVSGSPKSAVASPRRMPKHHHCKTCGKSFSSSSALQIHERTHTGERPFACTVCGRAFTTKGNLKVHMGTHMWNSAPSRRGCRLSTDRSLVGFGNCPVKLPEPPQKNPEMVSNSRDSVCPEISSAGLKMTGVCVVRRGGASFPSRLKKTPVDNPRVCLNKRHHTDHSDPPVVNGRNR